MDTGWNYLGIILMFCPGAKTPKPDEIFPDGTGSIQSLSLALSTTDIERERTGQHQFATNDKRDKNRFHLDNISPDIRSGFGCFVDPFPFYIIG